MNIEVKVVLTKENLLNNQDLDTIHIEDRLGYGYNVPTVQRIERAGNGQIAVIFDADDLGLHPENAVSVAQTLLADAQGYDLEELPCFISDPLDSQVKVTNHKDGSATVVFKGENF